MVPLDVDKARAWPAPTGASELSGPEPGWSEMSPTRWAASPWLTSRRTFFEARPRARAPVDAIRAAYRDTAHQRFFLGPGPAL